MDINNNLYENTNFFHYDNKKKHNIIFEVSPKPIIITTGLTINSGAIIGNIVVEFGGEGYISPPIITPSIGNMELTTIINNGSITSITINNSGSGYSTIPTFSITLPPTKITKKFLNKIIIDRKSDIYLNSFTTFNCGANTSYTKSAFIIDIDEIKIKSSSNNNNLSFNKIVIPNTSTRNIATRTHKGTKFNFICSINPCQINSLSLDITFLDKTNIFVEKDHTPNGGKYILELFITPY